MSKNNIFHISNKKNKPHHLKNIIEKIKDYINNHEDEKIEIIVYGYGTAIPNAIELCLDIITKYQYISIKKIDSSSKRINNKEEGVGLVEVNDEGKYLNVIEIKMEN